MKKTICFIMVGSMLFALTGCGKTKTLHCDKCNTEIVVKEKSNMEEDWFIYCEDCNEEAFGDDPVLGGD